MHLFKCLLRLKLFILAGRLSFSRGRTSSIGSFESKERSYLNYDFYCLRCGKWSLWNIKILQCFFGYKCLEDKAKLMGVVECWNFLLTILSLEMQGIQRIKLQNCISRISLYYHVYCLANSDRSLTWYIFVSYAWSLCWYNSKYVHWTATSPSSQIKTKSVKAEASRYCTKCVIKRLPGLWQLPLKGGLDPPKLLNFRKKSK